MKLIYCILLLLCPYWSSAQGLQPGEPLPALHFSNVLYHPANRISVNQLEAKLLILDFWATWCSSCIATFGFLDSVRRSNSGVEVILVNSKGTNDDKERVTKLFNRLNKTRSQPFQLPVALLDEQAKQLFPHKWLPHYVWIGADKKVLAITGAEALTAANIEMALQGKAPAAAAKTDKSDFKIWEPFFIKDTAMQVLQSSSLLPAMQGLATTAWVQRSKEQLVTARRYTNSPLLQLLMHAHYKAPLPNKIVYDQPLPARDSLYCYELMTRPVSMERSNQLMQQDLYRYFGLRAKMEVRLREVYVLTVDTSLIQQQAGNKGPRVNKLNDAGERYMQNHQLKTLVDLLYRTMDRPVIDESNYKALLTLALNTEDFSFKNMRRLLEPMGIGLQPAQRRMDCFVIY